MPAASEGSLWPFQHAEVSQPALHQRPWPGQEHQAAVRLCALPPPSGPRRLPRDDATGGVLGEHDDQGRAVGLWCRCRLWLMSGQCPLFTVLKWCENACAHACVCVNGMNLEVCTTLTYPYRSFHTMPVYTWTHTHTNTHTHTHTHTRTYHVMTSDRWD